MKCENCNNEFEGDFCPYCESNSLTEKVTDNKKKLNKLLGFRSNVLWKKIISIVYIIFCALFLLTILLETKYDNLPIGDFVIEKASNILIFIMMVSPYIFLSDTRIRNTLPLLKKKNLKTDIIVLLIVIVALGIFIGVADTFHSEEFLADRENHDYSITVTDATCEKDGEERKFCNYCGREETDIIPAFGHTMIEISKKEATENTEGKIVEECSVCGIQNTIVLEQLTTKAETEDEQTTVNAQTNPSTTDAAEQTTIAVIKDEQTTANVQSSTSSTEVAEQTTIVAQKYELTDYIGKSIQYVSEKLGDHLYEIDTNNYFYQDSKTNLSFDIYTNVLGAITAIKLVSSGDQGYTLCGLSSESGVAEGKKILTSKGFDKSKDNVWVSKSGKDIVMYVGDYFWVYEKDSPLASKEALKKATLESYEYRYDDSEATVYLGNGQLIEILNDSFTEFTYNYSNLTSYQQTELKRNIEGRYVRVHGSISSVSSIGTIVIYCDDYKQKNDLIFAGTASASVKLLLQQNNLLMSLNEGDEIVVYARIKADSYESFLGTAQFDLYDGILYSINNSNVEIPIFDGNIDGINRYIPTDYSLGHGGGSDL